MYVVRKNPLTYLQFVLHGWLCQYRGCRSRKFFICGIELFDAWKFWNKQTFVLCVYLFSGQYVPIFQLSINRFNDQSSVSGGGAFLELLRYLHFPLYKVSTGQYSISYLFWGHCVKLKLIVFGWEAQLQKKGRKQLPVVYKDRNTKVFKK